MVAALTNILAVLTKAFARLCLHGDAVAVLAMIIGILVALVVVNWLVREFFD